MRLITRIPIWAIPLTVLINLLTICLNLGIVYALLLALDHVKYQENDGYMLSPTQSRTPSTVQTYSGTTVNSIITFNDSRWLPQNSSNTRT